jgi:nucleoside-diphosphate-sugar epimerase
MKIAVTGATGFVGGALVSYLTQQGHEVIRLQRRSIAAPEDRFFDMRSIDSIPDLTGIDALIHTAFIKYDRMLLPDSSDINIATTLALELACHRGRTKFVFLSTMSAHTDAVSHYGQHKYEIEKMLDTTKDLILRLGLVIGEKGLFESMRSAISKGAFIPLVASGSQPIQTIAVTDVCRIIEKALLNNISGSYTIGSPQVYTLKDLYTAIAKRMDKNPIFISIPYALINFALSTIEVLRIPFNVSKENLLGLKQLKAFDTKKDLEKLNVSILDMDQALDLLMKKNK